MDLVRVSSPTYAEIAARQSPVTILPQEEGIGIIQNEYHPWLLKHIPPVLFERKYLTELEAGHHLGASITTIPPDFSMQKIFTSICFDPQMGLREKEILERRVYRLFCSSMGKTFLEYINSLGSKTILSLRKFEKFVQVIVNAKKVEENRCPLEWIGADTREKCDQILEKMLKGSSFLFIKRDHPQKREILRSLHQLSMRPTGQDFLLKLNEAFQGREWIEIEYKKGKNNCSAEVSKRDKIRIFIDIADPDCYCSMDMKGNIRPIKVEPVTLLAHELLHALNTLYRSRVSIEEQEEIKQKMIEEVVFSHSLRTYSRGTDPVYYKDFSSRYFSEEQQVIIGALKGEQEEQVYPITENAMRFCFFLNLRINHYYFNETQFGGRVFSLYESTVQPFDFFGDVLCDDLQVAIRKVDRVAIETLLDIFSQEKITKSLDTVMSEIQKLSPLQRECLYEVVEKVFKKHTSKKFSPASLFDLPLKGAIRLINSTTVNPEEVKRFCRLLRNTKFSLKAIYYTREALKKIKSLLPFYTEECKRVNQLLCLADAYQKRSGT